MESAAPIKIDPKAAIANGEVNIAFAVGGVFGEFTCASSTLLRNAIRAGLRRKGVQFSTHGDYFLKYFAVALVSVPCLAKAAAVESVRETLTELELIDAATIAIYTDELVWVTMQGFGVGGVNFEKIFIRPKDLEEARAQIEELMKTSTQRTTGFLLDLYERLANAKGETDQK